VEDDTVSQEIRAESLNANLSPDAFHLYAIHYYKCKLDFNCPDSFSPVPYFLLCRAIELEIKSRHLKHQNQTKVKMDYGHNLLKAYNALDQKEQVLNSAEVATLEAASNIYDNKGF